jgi:hypothetical protein
MPSKYLMSGKHRNPNSEVQYEAMSSGPQIVWSNHCGLFVDPWLWKLVALSQSKATGKSLQTAETGPQHEWHTWSLLYDKVRHQRWNLHRSLLMLAWNLFLSIARQALATWPLRLPVLDFITNFSLQYLQTTFSSPSTGTKSFSKCSQTLDRVRRGVKDVWPSILFKIFMQITKKINHY